MSHGMSLVIIVPRALSQNLSEVEDKLSGPVFLSMMAKLETIPFKPTIVSLPKFKVDSSQDLMEIIGAMGKKSQSLMVSDGQRRGEALAHFPHKGEFT